MTEFLNSLFNLNGKAALVTGGSKGLGYMMAKSMVKAGAHVIVVSRSAEDCQRVAEELGQFGECTALPADLSTKEGIQGLVDRIAADFSALHILVNNAGSTWGAPLDTYPAAKWDKVMDLNVKSPFFLMQKLLPQMEVEATAETPSKVINIGSVGGLGSQILGAYAYAASKAAILHLTKGLARELASRHILVNAIAPGYFPSKMTKHIQVDENFQNQVLAEVPLKRFGRKEELGALAIYLSSNASNYITGQTVVIDGGFLIR